MILFSYGASQMHNYDNNSVSFKEIRQIRLSQKDTLQKYEALAVQLLGSER